MKATFYYCIGLLLAIHPVLNVQAKAPYRSENCTNRIVNDGDYLWILASEGIVRYEKKTGKSEPVVFDLGKVMPTDIVSIAKDKTGHLWIGTDEDGVFKCDGVTTEQYLGWPEKFPGVPTEIRSSFAFDSENNAWSGGFWFYYAIANKQKGWTVPSTPHSTNTGTHTILDMEFDSKDNLWMAVEFPYGCFLCHPKGGNKCINIYEEKLPYESAYALAIDSKDNIWLTFNDGIHYYEPSTKTDKIYTPELYPDIPKAKFIACRMDEKGNVWFAASKYLLKYDGNKFTTYTCEGFDQARSLLCDGDAIWIYTSHDDLLCFHQEEFKRVKIASGDTGMTPPESNATGFRVTGRKRNFHISGTVGISSVAIYDMTARLILSAKYSGEENTVVVEVPSGFTKGVYLLKISYTGGETTIKTVVRE